MSTALFVGTAGFGADDPHAILKLRLSHADGTLSVGGEPTKTAGKNPGWVLVPAGRGCAFVGMEDEDGSIQGYTIDKDDASKLSVAGESVSSVGQHPCSLALDASGKWLLVRTLLHRNAPTRFRFHTTLHQQLLVHSIDVSRRAQAANYSSASIAVFPVNDDCSVGPATDSKAHWESTDPILADRQEMCEHRTVNPIQLILIQH